MELTLAMCVNAAKSQTRRSAEMKDWRIRNKVNRRMREHARALVEKNGGYLIATPAEIAEKYGENVGRGSKRYVWSIDWNFIYKRLQFTPIYG